MRLDKKGKKLPAPPEGVYMCLTGKGGWDACVGK